MEVNQTKDLPTVNRGSKLNKRYPHSKPWTGTLTMDLSRGHDDTEAEHYDKGDLHVDWYVCTVGIYNEIMGR